MTIASAYRVELRGRLSEQVLGPYACEFVISRTHDRTVLSGTVRDAAHLHGIVTHLTSLGLDLVSVAQVEAPAARPDQP
jgi:hypothetical protein